MKDKKEKLEKKSPKEYDVKKIYRASSQLSVVEESVEIEAPIPTQEVFAEELATI